MSERTTAEIADAVRTCAAFADPRSAQRCIDAADRLVELDAEALAYETELARIDALLPDDVSIEQLVATYNAVWKEGIPSNGVTGVYEYLRSVKP